MNKFFNSSNEILWQSKNLIRGISGQKIETVDEYVEWVAEWKQIHNQLVEAIKYFRFLKNEHKHNGAYEQCGRAWINKKTLGSWAKMLYTARVDNKAKLKAGAFKEAEKV